MGGRPMRGGAVGRSWAVAGGLVLALVGAPARGGEPPGFLAGRVVDAEGEGVAGASVRASLVAPGVGRRAISLDLRAGADGRFRSPPVEPTPGPARLTVQAAGFADLSAPIGRAAIFSGRETDLGSIRLERGRVFTGRVVDADGSPRGRVALDLHVLRLGRGHAAFDVGPPGRLEADADGRFRTPPLPVGRLLLTVRVPERRLASVAGRAIPPGGAEDLGTIRLEPDAPIAVAVRDEAGRPVADAILGGTMGIRGTSGPDGMLTIRGAGPGAVFPFTLRRAGFVPCQGVLVVDDRGLRFTPGVPAPAGAGPDIAPDPTVEPVRDLALTLRRAGAFDALALDAETGEPLAAAQVLATLSRVARSPGGAPALTRVEARMVPLARGRFRVAFDGPGEYHLAVAAEGYRPAEVFTPRAAEGATVGGVVARLQPARDDVPHPVAQSLSGTVTRLGRPVATGWATLATREPPSMAPHAAILRGRTVPNPLVPRASAPIRDGSYALDAPEPGAAYTLAIDEPGQPPAVVGPFPLRAGEARTLDAAGPAPGRIRGRVRGVPADWREVAWVVAFDAAGLRFEAPVGPDGSFALPELPPGEYGLKAGHDAYEDAEVYPGRLVLDHPEAYQVLADPWRRAVRVRVEAGRDVEGVEVAWPD